MNARAFDLGASASSHQPRRWETGGWDPHTQTVAALTYPHDPSAAAETWWVEAPGGAPAWFQFLVSEINGLAELTRGWDSYNGEPLAPKAAIFALELLTTHDFSGPAPWVSPSPDGALHMEWRSGPRILQVEVNGDGDVDVAEIDDEVAEEWRTSCAADDPRLLAALRELNGLLSN